MKTMTLPRWLILLVLLAIALGLLSVVMILFLRPVATKPDAVLTFAPTNPPEPSVAASSPLFTEDDTQRAQIMKTNPLQKVLSGNGKSVSYTQELAKAEVIVGHAFRFEHTSHSAVFMLAGPGTFEFAVSSGAWYKHTNTTPALNEALLQTQIDIMVNKYHVPLKSVKIHRLEPQPPAEH